MDGVGGRATGGIGEMGKVREGRESHDDTVDDCINREIFLAKNSNVHYFI